MNVKRIEVVFDKPFDRYWIINRNGVTKVLACGDRGTEDIKHLPVGTRWAIDKVEDRIVTLVSGENERFHLKTIYT